MTTGADLDPERIRASVLAMSGNPSYRPPVINDIDFVSSRASAFKGEAYSQKRIRKIGPKINSQPKKPKTTTNKHARKKKSDLTSLDTSSSTQKGFYSNSKSSPLHSLDSTVKLRSKDIENIFSPSLLGYDVNTLFKQSKQTSREKRRKNHTPNEKQCVAMYHECPYIRKTQKKKRIVRKNIFQRENKRLENIVKETEKQMEKRMKYYKRTLDMYEFSPCKNLLPLEMDKSLRSLLAICVRSILRRGWKAWREFNDIVQRRIDYWTNLARAIHEVSSTFWQGITGTCIHNIVSRFQVPLSPSENLEECISEGKKIESSRRIQAVWRGYVYGRIIVRKRMLENLQHSLCRIEGRDITAISYLLNLLTNDDKKTLYVCQDMMNKSQYLDYLPSLDEIKRAWRKLQNITEISDQHCHQHHQNDFLEETQNNQTFESSLADSDSNESDTFDDESASYCYSSDSEDDDVRSTIPSSSRGNQTMQDSQHSTNQVWSVQDYKAGIFVHASNRYMANISSKSKIKVRAFAETFVVMLFASSCVALQRSNKTHIFSEHILGQRGNKGCFEEAVSSVQNVSSSNCSSFEMHVHDLSTTFVNDIITTISLQFTSLQLADVYHLHVQKQTTLLFVSELMKEVVRDISLSEGKKINPPYTKSLISIISNDRVALFVNEALANTCKYLTL
mmetsp:Transcript_22564/g.33241  ORF Transcript_22564/g.33241 Transcript_22564/m.33241 type:complete len:676 (-) Transcript_22564:33-2060(-)